jgi:hypothetical protein
VLGARWADCDVVHLSTGGALIKTLRSNLSVTDLRRLVADGAVNAGPVPKDGDMLEVDRLVNRYGMVTLANKVVLAPRSWPDAGSGSALNLPR